LPDFLDAVDSLASPVPGWRFGHMPEGARHWIC
jgi:hypothetical protein